MNNVELVKPDWEAPTIIDLDIDKTAGGWIQNGVESSTGTLS